jgi:hypothetical protein
VERFTPATWSTQAWWALSQWSGVSEKLPDLQILHTPWKRRPGLLLSARFLSLCWNFRFLSLYWIFIYFILFSFGRGHWGWPCAVSTNTYALGKVIMSTRHCFLFVYFWFCVLSLNSGTLAC